MAGLRLFLAALAAGLCLSIAPLTGCQRSAEPEVSSSSASSPSVVREDRQTETERAPSPPSLAAGESSLSADHSEASVSPQNDSTPAARGKAVAHRFEIRDRDGKPILTDRQIVAYDWKTHRITLEPGTKVEPKLKEGESLVFGIPFAVAADGVICYSGVFTTSSSSISQSVPVIDVHPLDVEEGTLRIELGYPAEQFFRGIDPRGDKRVRTALDELGILKEEVAF